MAYSAEALLTGVTVSGNTAGNVGGGIYLYGTSANGSRLAGCTITGNSAQYGGGLYRSGLDVRLDNTIVAGNSATYYPDLYGGYNSKSSNNLVGIGTGLSGIADGTRGNQVGTSQSPIDAVLGDLAWNGGPTKTHMPGSNSPAVDAGSTLLARAYFDGRGENYRRTVGVGTDNRRTNRDEKVHRRDISWNLVPCSIVWLR